MTEGIWDQFTADKYHQSSPKLAAWLAGYLSKEKSVIDFGCGNAFYCAELAKLGFESVGVEGFPLNNFLHDQIAIMDLTKPFNMPIRGSVISLEVGEHLPKEFEQTFLDNITNHCSGDLVLSWALPKQPGIGHVNCLPQEYVINEVVKRGFDYYPLVTVEAREHIDDNCDWFRRTLLVFGKK
jgi:SAM-dependent methyltransferase